MKVTVTARHFDLTDDLKSLAEARLGRFGRFMDGLLKAHVVLEVEKYRQLAEVSVHGRNGDFTGRAESADMATSLDAACDKVEKQIRRHARKIRNHKGEVKGAIEMPDIRMQSERRTCEMMTLEEATGRIEGGEEIVVFSDTDTGATRVVYRRQDGSLKMIELAS